MTDRRERKEEDVKIEDGRNEDRILLEMDSISRNEEFARVVMAVFMSRMNPTLEELDDVKTAVSEAVTNAIIHGYRQEKGIVYIEGIIAGNELRQCLSFIYKHLNVMADLWLASESQAPIVENPLLLYF